MAAGPGVPVTANVGQAISDLLSALQRTGGR
jgi:hypothetical protein